MVLTQWSIRALALVAVICAIGAFLIDSSSSQEPQHGTDASEVGRYQYVVGARGGDTIFDTKTGRFWQRSDSGVDDKVSLWVEHASAFAK